MSAGPMQRQCAVTVAANMRANVAALEQRVGTLEVVMVNGGALAGFSPWGYLVATKPSRECRVRFGFLVETEGICSLMGSLSLWDIEGWELST
jgi:hypothetical protein